MDRSSGSTVRNIGIGGGQIRAISSEALKGKQTIDARTRCSAGSSIWHEHGQEARNYQFQARDGVNTSLELEAALPMWTVGMRQGKGSP